MARILYQGPGSDIGETVMRAPSSKDATMAMSEDLATFSEALQPPQPVSADSLTMQEAEPQIATAPGAQTGGPQAAGGTTSGGANRRYLATCGCLVILGAIACGATIFLLDALAPDAIYCGPGERLFELLGFVMDCG